LWQVFYLLGRSFDGAGLWYLKLNSFGQHKLRFVNNYMWGGERVKSYKLGCWQLKLLMSRGRISGIIYFELPRFTSMPIITINIKEPFSSNTLKKGS